MKKFIINENLLTEAVSTTSIIRAMDNKEYVEIYYAGDKTVNKGWRTIEIYCLGVTKAGNEAIRAFQIGGETDTIIPEWKIFLTNKITKLNFLKTNFTKPRPKFNKNGDRTFRYVKKIVKFDNVVTPKPENKPNQVVQNIKSSEQPQENSNDISQELKNNV